MRCFFYFNLILLILLTGCAVKSETTLIKSKEKRLNLSPESAQTLIRYTEDIELDPEAATLTKEDIKVYVEHLDSKELSRFFNNQERFGKFADGNPYPKDLIVFYVRIANNSSSRLKLETNNIVLIDDIKSQHSFLNPDYILSLYKIRSSLYSMSKSTQGLAPGGFYGAPVEMATSLAGRGVEKKFIQLQTVELTGGFIHSGVEYDGLIAFFKPSWGAKNLRLIFSGIKTRFDVTDKPMKEVAFEFPFNIIFP